MKDFRKRSVTGICIVIATCLVIVSGPVAFFILCAGIGVVGLFEFYRLFGITGNLIRVVPSFLLAAGILTGVYIYMNLRVSPVIFLVNIPAISFVLLSALFEKSSNPFYNIGIVFLGQIYIVLSVSIFYCYSFVLNGGFNAEIVIGYFLLLWASDMGGYIFGNLLGRHTLASRISPNKTWEGSLGGTLLAGIITYINSLIFHSFSPVQWMILGIIVVVFGTLGDLLKSRMKRSFNVKDFGVILPGHGGILDRFDSLLGSIPLAYCYIYADIYVFT
jgi:phosphatidate cytidylyltransferase